MAGDAKRLPARFYRTAQGSGPVRGWLKELPPEARRVIGFDLKDAEYSWPVGMPLCRSLGRGLWEVRSKRPNGRSARAIFCVHEGRMLLHGFIKKTQRTPPQEVELVLRRRQEVER